MHIEILELYVTAISLFIYTLILLKLELVYLEIFSLLLFKTFLSFSSTISIALQFSHACQHN